MSDKSHKVVLLLKIVLRANSAGEKNTARAQAAMMCAKHALDYDALLAQAAESLNAENPEAQAAQQAPKVDNGPTWAETPRDVWETTTKYDPNSRDSRKLLARALRSLLGGAGFTLAYGGEKSDTSDEVWEKVVGHTAFGELKVLVGTSIRCGMVGPKGGDPIRMWSTVGDRLLINYRTKGGRKGHTVRRCGEFGQWQDGADHGHKNNPGILGRVYRELLNVRDASRKAVSAQDYAPPAQMGENDEDFLRRVMREFSAKLRTVAHPSRHAPEGATMYDYIGWCLENRYDRQGRDRWSHARRVYEKAAA